MATFIDRVRHSISASTPVQRLVGLNIAVFVLLRLTAGVFLMSGHADWQHWLLESVTLSSVFADMLHRPWTVVVYMVAQYDVLHLLFNMMWLWLFGNVYSEVADSRRTPVIYLLGGLAGAMVYIVAGAIWPDVVTGGLIGSSAAVMAVMAVAALTVPDYRVNLLLFGSVRLKWLAVAMLVFELIAITAGNIGGHAAHAGGLIAGGAIFLYYRGVSRRRLQAVKKGTQAPMPDGEYLDVLLDKVRRSGFGSLTAEERGALFRISGNLSRK